MAKTTTRISRGPAKRATVDQYLAGVSGDKRAALQRLRKTILAVVPDAEECISYGMPGYRYKGKMLVWFGAAARHCSFFPGGVVNECQDALAGYATSKGTVRFAPDRPLPAAIVRRLIKARMARIAPKPLQSRRR